MEEMQIVYEKLEKTFENALPKVFAAGVEILFVIVSSLGGGGTHYSFEKGQDGYNAFTLDGLVAALTDGEMAVKGFGLYTDSFYLQYAVYGDDPVAELLEQARQIEPSRLTYALIDQYWGRQKPVKVHRRELREFHKHQKELEKIDAAKTSN